MNIDALLQHVATVRAKQSDQILLEQLGISMSQYRVIAVLSDIALKQRKIADMLAQTEASISRQIGVLVDKGLVGVRPDPTSRRQLLVGLTVKGTRILQAATQLLESSFNDSLTALDAKQRVQLQDALKSLHYGLCAAGGTGACDHFTDKH